MRVDETSGKQPPAPPQESTAGSSHASTTNGSAATHANGHDVGGRTSEDTIRREPIGGDSFNLSNKAASIQPLSELAFSSRDGNSEPAQHTKSVAPSQEISAEASGSRSRDASPAPASLHRKVREPSVDDDEDVWEDEEDSIVTDEHGNIIYGGPDYDDSASDFSDDADAEELKQHRRSYREATQQYRKSRRALLLSGLSSSHASSPSPSSDDLGSASPPMRHGTSASPSSSIYERDTPAPEQESYYQPHLAEAVDSADTGGRASSLKYDYDSAEEEKRNRRSSDSPISKVKVKIESDDELPLTYEHNPQTPKDLHFDTTSMDSRGAEAAVTRSPHLRPPPSPRHPSLLDLQPSTPVNNKSSESKHTSSKEGPSQQRLAPSPLILDNDSHELLEAYMTPRLSISMLHDEPRFDFPPHKPDQKPEHEAEDKKELQRKPDIPTAASRSRQTPFSLWDYLKEEVLATDFDATQEMKWERVTNFISIPFWMEKIIMFGFIVCLDSFLYTFTIMPLRFGVAMWTWIGNSARWILGGQKRYLHASQKCDILKMLLIVLSCVILSRITDASKMYHSVRGQDVVKLSVIFNVLEIADRLCCSFGQDLLDSLFSRSTLARRKNGKQPYLRPIGFFCLSLAYVLAHTLVLFYQLVTLNVAINSYDNALLTLLLSNQFVEIKSSVFKKFEKENVFQMTCADIVERFQLTLMLSAIGLRNLIELSGGSLEPSSSPLPASFTVFPSLSLLETVLTPVCIVLASECIVDWLKHAFITKFNHIRPAVYGRFMDVLCRDLVVGGPSTKENSRKHTFVDQSPIISRRLGFAALPLACLLVRLILQIIGMIGIRVILTNALRRSVHVRDGSGRWRGS